MNAEIIISLVSLLGTLAGSLGGILVSSKLTNYRIEQLEKRLISTTDLQSECRWSRSRLR